MQSISLQFAIRISFGAFVFLTHTILDKYAQTCVSWNYDDEQTNVRNLVSFQSFKVSEQKT